MRLVVDTNNMIRALLTDGPARQFFRAAPLTHTIVYHPEQLDELREVAHRPRLSIAQGALDELIWRLLHYGEDVDSPLNEGMGCRDPNDDYILALAKSGSVEIIISEDQDLLSMSPWNGIRIVRLIDFIKDYPL